MVGKVLPVKTWKILPWDESESTICDDYSHTAINRTIVITVVDVIMSLIHVQPNVLLNNSMRDSLWRIGVPEMDGCGW
jgi:hypothetical protein